MRSIGSSWCCSSCSRPFRVEFRLAAAAVARQRAGLAGRVRSLEYPVLPCGEAGEDLGFHRFRAGKAQIGLKAREAVRRKAGALLEKEADFVVPVDVVERESDEAERCCDSGVQHLADRLAGFVESLGLAEKACVQSVEAVAHGKCTGQIDVSQDD